MKNALKLSVLLVTIFSLTADQYKRTKSYNDFNGDDLKEELAELNKFAKTMPICSQEKKDCKKFKEVLQSIHIALIANYKEKHNVEITKSLGKELEKQRILNEFASISQATSEEEAILTMNTCADQINNLQKIEPTDLEKQFEGAIFLRNAGMLKLQTGNTSQDSRK